jgi:hypothetical protein
MLSGFLQAASQASRILLDDSAIPVPHFAQDVAQVVAQVIAQEHVISPDMVQRAG